MPRFFLPPEAWTGQPALTGEEAKHCAQVLRMGRGDEVEVFDGRGRRARARVQSASRQRVELALEPAAAAGSPVPRVTLFQAIPKGKTMDVVVQKAVELGVAAIQPLLTRHTVIRLDAGDAARKAEKWQRVALEACKQCGQDTLPEVRPPLTFAEALSAGQASERRILASLAPGAVPLRELLRGGRPEGVDLLVGPEGDFSPEETDAALAAGFSPASLGDIILRVETAALFALAAIRYEFGGT